MSQTLPLPLYKKLSVTFRIEPGCLGPDGIDHVEGFCKHAKTSLAGLDTDFVRWVVVPRYDKQLAETEYKTNNKVLNFEQAQKYLRAFNKELDDFEEHLHDHLGTLIDEYLGRTVAK